MKLRLAGILRESVVDGPGIRTVIFAQGCPHRCPGCHNPETHDPHGGKEYTIAQVVSSIMPNRLVRGITFSGGEPFQQAEGFAHLGKILKEKGLDIVTYTGYTFEEILAKSQVNHDVLKLLQVSDLLVEGPYVEALRDLSLAYRGSRNQRIVNVQSSLQVGRVIQIKIA